MPGAKIIILSIILYIIWGFLSFFLLFMALEMKPSALHMLGYLPYHGDAPKAPPKED